MELFAATAPGLETITVGELKRLGVKAKAEPGGVSYRGDLATLYATNLWLRTPSRIVARIASFHASTFHELERRAKRIRWSDFISPGVDVRVRVTCRKSRLYHSDAVAERLLGVIAAAVPGSARVAAETAPDDFDRDTDDKSGSAAQLFIARIVDDECELSVDTSGELLHRRGYRQEIAKAPLRETLAAAMLLASGWKSAQPLVDPLCGSGTILIEAALLSRGIPPGFQRRFAFMDWPGFDEQKWAEILASARRAVVRSRSLVLIGADRDKGAIDAAQNNAARAGVGGDISWAVQPLSATLGGLADFPDPGWILANPPYGVRLGEPDDLRDLYATLGSRLKSADGWRLGLLTSDVALARQTGLPLRSRFSTRNGGIPVAFLAQDRVAAGRVTSKTGRAG